MTPAERAGAAPTASASPAATPSVPATAPTPPPAAPAPSDASLAARSQVAALQARLAEERRDVETISKRWAEQTTTLEAALTAAQNAKRGDPAWALAQKELTRLNQLMAQYSEAQRTVEQISGQLAGLSVEGVPISDALGDAGRLMRRLAQVQAEGLASVQAAQRRLGT